MVIEGASIEAMIKWWWNSFCTLLERRGLGRLLTMVTESNEGRKVKRQKKRRPWHLISVDCAREAMSPRVIWGRVILEEDDRASSAKAFWLAENGMWIPHTGSDPKRVSQAQPQTLHAFHNFWVSHIRLRLYSIMLNDPASLWRSQRRWDTVFALPPKRVQAVKLVLCLPV
jgi:hypothetical protein